MLAAIGESMGSKAVPSHPDGGLYLWLRLPEGAAAAASSQKAREHGVAYLAGPSFSPSGAGANCLRLCYGNEDGDGIAKGIAALAEVFAEAGYLK